MEVAIYTLLNAFMVEWDDDDKWGKDDTKNESKHDCSEIMSLTKDGKLKEGAARKRWVDNMIWRASTYQLLGSDLVSRVGSIDQHKN